MTIREALVAHIPFEVPNPSLIDKVLIDANLTGTDTYSLSNKTVVEAAELDLLKALVIIPDFTEGDLSMKYNTNGMQARISQLSAKPGEIAGVPTIRNASNLW